MELAWPQNNTQCARMWQRARMHTKPRKPPLLTSKPQKNRLKLWQCLNLNHICQKIEFKRIFLKNFFTLNLDFSVFRTKGSEQDVLPSKGALSLQWFEYKYVFSDLLAMSFVFKFCLLKWLLLALHAIVVEMWAAVSTLAEQVLTWLSLGFVSLSLRSSPVVHLSR